VCDLVASAIRQPKPELSSCGTKYNK